MSAHSPGATFANWFRGLSLALFTVDPARGVLVVEYCAGPAAERLGGLTMSVGQRVSGWVASNSRAILNADAVLDLGQDHADLRSALAIPLVADGAVVGVMTLYGPHSFAENCSRRLEMVAPHLATAVASVVTARTGIELAAFASARTTKTGSTLAGGAA